MVLEDNSFPQSLTELLQQLNEENVTGYRRYARVKTYLNFKAREKGVPISGTFELTPFCNLDCKMCYVHLSADQIGNSRLLSVDAWKQIMKEAVEAGMLYATLTGGECLTYPGFKDIYLYLQSMGIEVGILSNGLLIDSEMLHFFLEHPPAALQITLYGSDDDAYEKVTGVRCFNTVWNNILRIKNTDIPFKVSVTPNEYMADGEKVIRLLHANGIAFGINEGILKPREETGRTAHDTPLEMYIKMFKLSAELNGFDRFQECDPEDMPDPNRSSQKQIGVRCGAGRSSFAIRWDGTMHPCNMFPVISEKPLDAGFREAWKKINEQVNGFPIPSECFGCYYENVCKQCVVEHANSAPIGHVSARVCERVMKMVKEGIYKVSKEW